MIDIQPPASWEECDAALYSLYMYDGLIFTSANGVDFFLKRLTERNISLEECRKKSIIVVGEKTKKVCEENGLAVTIMPEKFSSHDLLKALRQVDLRDRVFLYPKGNLAKEYLAGNLKTLGAKVDTIDVYLTVKPQPEEVQHSKMQILSGEINAITFTSPSTVVNFLSLFSPQELERLKENQLVVVIGPVTEHAARGAGFTNIHCASPSTTEGMVGALIKIFNIR